MAKETKEKREKTASCDLQAVLDNGPMPVTIGGVPVGFVQPKEFSTGSFGWGFNGPVCIPLVGGGIAECQVGLNVTVKHSKPKA